MSGHTYLNPSLIQLDNLDFQKLDIQPGSAQLIQTDFGITHAGVINGITFEVDRVNQELKKQIGDLSLNTTSNKLNFTSRTM